jgi:predicted alpha/beta hydrolase family esterase
MSSCEQVSCGPRDKAVADVVFLHGIQGDQKKTWTNANGGFWPSWLAQDSAELGVWSLGYEAAVSAWTGTAMALYDRANNLLAQVRAAGIGDRPICWVAHSLGGLLVKQMLRNADGLAPRYKPISAATRGVVFIATPHTGSDLASVARYLGFLLRINAAGKELQALSAPLFELNTWYRENHRRMGVATEVFFETQTTKGVQVVDRGSADPGLEGVVPIGLDADHVSICKPSGRGDLIYQCTKTFIDSQLAPPAARRATADGVEEPAAPGSCTPASTAHAQASPSEAVSAADLVALGHDQLRVLRECITALRHLTGCLADVRQTPRLSTGFVELSAQAVWAVDVARDQLHALALQVDGRSWPHRDWALLFSDAERNFRRNSGGGDLSFGTKLAGSIANVLRILENQYPSLFVC